MVTVGADNVDIGANPSAEEGEDALDESTKQVNDVAHSFQLSPMFEGQSKVYKDFKGLQSQLKGTLRGEHRYGWHKGGRHRET